MSETSILDEIAAQQRRSILLVITGPSGSGKDTVIAKLLEEDPAIIKIVTTTSRKMRAGERQGSPYFFVDREEFEKLIADGAFFEWVEFRGALYGTQKQTLLDALSRGANVIWKIEAKGVKNMREKIKEMVPRSVFVFLSGVDTETLKNRVYAAEGELNAPLRWNESLVLWEMKQFEDCEYLVVNENDKLEETVATIQSIVEAKRREILPEQQ